MAEPGQARSAPVCNSNELIVTTEEKVDHQFLLERNHSERRSTREGWGLGS